MKRTVRLFALLLIGIGFCSAPAHAKVSIGTNPKPQVSTLGNAPDALLFATILFTYWLP